MQIYYNFVLIINSLKSNFYSFDLITSFTVNIYHLYLHRLHLHWACCSECKKYCLCEQLFLEQSSCLPLKQTVKWLIKAHPLISAVVASSFQIWLQYLCFAKETWDVFMHETSHEQQRHKGEYWITVHCCFI